MLFGCWKDGSNGRALQKPLCTSCASLRPLGLVELRCQQLERISLPLKASGSGRTDRQPGPAAEGMGETDSTSGSAEAACKPWPAHRSNSVPFPHHRHSPCGHFWPARKKRTNWWFPTCNSHPRHRLWVSAFPWHPWARSHGSLGQKRHTHIPARSSVQPVQKEGRGNVKEVTRTPCGLRRSRSILRYSQTKSVVLKQTLPHHSSSP